LLMERIKNMAFGEAPLQNYAACISCLKTGEHFSLSGRCITEK
jgi:hypothetical protein